MPYPRPDKSDVEAYLKSMTDHDKIAMEIAKNQLGSSFNVEKSIGFIQWLSENKAQ